MATLDLNYEVVKVYDDFEIRKYPEVVVAEAHVNSKIEEASEKAFPLLAGYVFGGNHKHDEAIPETPNLGQKISLASPLSVSTHGDEQTMDFYLPDFHNLDETPEPNDPKVEIKKIPERLVAVYTYSGMWSEEKYNAAKDKLGEALEREHIQPKSDPIWARYNPPWWPWFMRRNEIWYEV
jgi:hypothetical protein